MKRVRRPKGLKAIMSHQPSTIILTQKTQKTQKTLVALAVTSGVVTLPTTDYSDFTDCCKSRCSCWAAELNALSTINHQLFILTQISQISRKMHSYARICLQNGYFINHRLLGITQIFASCYALAKRRSRMLLSP